MEIGLCSGDPEREINLALSKNEKITSLSVSIHLLTWKVEEVNSG